MNLVHEKYFTKFIYSLDASINLLTKWLFFLLRIEINFHFTVWKLLKFTLFGQKFREINGFTKEIIE